MLEVSAGGFLGLGARHVLLPMEAVTNVGKDEVHVNQSREHVAKSPAYEPQLIKRPPRDYWEPYYGYYGYSPYWSAGYMHPGSPRAFDDPLNGSTDLREGQRDRT